MTRMTRTKFQIGDAVRFLTTNSDWGYLKGHTGTVKDIESSTSEGRAIYKVAYKHAVTGQERWSYFTSRDLEKVKIKTELSEFVDYTPLIDSVKHYEDEIKPKKEQKENWDSWDDFCDKFKGELFKD